MYWYEHRSKKKSIKWFWKKFSNADSDSFIVYIKTDDIYKDIAEDVETRCETSSYELDRPLPKRKIKK